jgi:SAM-dependent methyltransferase
MTRNASNEDREAAYWSSRASAFDRLYESSTWWERLLRESLRRRHDAVIGTVRALDGPAVCDFGCGTGRQLAGAVAAGACRGVGVDLSSEMGQLARQRWTRLGLENRLSVHVGDALHWRTDEKFDVVWALGVFDYIDEPGPLLRKMASVSKGMVLATFRRVWALRSPFRKVTYHLRGKPIYLYTRHRVQRELEAAGLRRVTVERLHGTCYLARGVGGRGGDP